MQQKLKQTNANDISVGGTHYDTNALSGEGLEAWDVAMHWCRNDNGKRAGLRFTAIKYLSRLGDKGDYYGDVDKAIHYLVKLKETQAK